MSNKLSNTGKLKVASTICTEYLKILKQYKKDIEHLIVDYCSRENEKKCKSRLKWINQQIKGMKEIQKDLFKK